jgi:hypothetical protein
MPHWLARILKPERVEFLLAAQMIAMLTIYVVGMAMLDRKPMLDPGGSAIGGDFIAFYTGGRFFLEGETEHLYDFERQQAFQWELFDGALGSLWHPFINPPNAVLVYLPFSLGDYWTGLLLWKAANLACLVLALGILRPILPGGWTFWQLVKLPLLFTLTLTWIYYGQATGLIFLIWSATLVLLVRNREFAAGFVLALLAFKPQLAIPLAIPLIVQLRWRALLGGIVGLGLWGVLIALFLSQPAAEFVRIADDVFAMFASASYPRQGVHSIFGFYLLLLQPIAPAWIQPLSTITMLVVLGGLIVLWWRVSWRPGDPLWWTRVAITLVLGSLLCVQLFSYDVFLWLLPMAIVGGLVPARRDTLLDGGPVFLLSALIYLWVPWGPLAYRFLFEWLQQNGLPPVAIQWTPLLALAWAVAVWTRLGPPASEPAPTNSEPP